MAQVGSMISKASDGFGTLLGWLVFLLIAWFVVAYLLPDGWRIKYAMRYLVSYEHVSVEARPTKCDFFHTPIGEKSCHYEKQISTAIWETSTTGHPIVSNDERKTWEERDPPPNVKLPTEYVFVDWNKIEDP